MEINKTVIVASRWFLFYLTYIDDARSITNRVLLRDSLKNLCFHILHITVTRPLPERFKIYLFYVLINKKRNVRHSLLCTRIRKYSNHTFSIIHPQQSSCLHLALLISKTLFIVPTDAHYYTNHRILKTI